LILVRIALKSVALSLVFSRATIWMPAALRVFSTSLARPSPYAVASSAIATFFSFCPPGTARPRALLVVAADGGTRLEALLGQLRVGRRTGDHRDAGLVVDGGGGDRHARVQVADDAGDLGVGEFLRDRRSELRVGLVVFGQHLELDRLAAELDLPGVRFVDGQAHAVLVVLAEVGDAAGQRAGVGDLDGDGLLDRRRSLGRFGLLGLFLAATVQGDCCGGDEGQAELARDVHGLS
jgi:hypothetical protein